MFTFLLWCLLFFLCWPLALMALIAYPIVWLLLLPLRIVGVAVAAVVCLASGHVAAAVVGHGWPRYRPADSPGILARVLTNLHNPGLAWDPVNRGGAVPGPVIFWAVFAALAAIPLAVAYLALRQRPSSHSAAWASLRNLRRLRVRGQRHGRLVVGTAWPAATGSSRRRSKAGT